MSMTLPSATTSMSTATTTTTSNPNKRSFEQTNTGGNQFQDDEDNNNSHGEEQQQQGGVKLFKTENGDAIVSNNAGVPEEQEQIQQDSDLVIVKMTNFFPYECERDAEGKIVRNEDGSPFNVLKEYLSYNPIKKAKNHKIAYASYESKNPFYVQFSNCWCTPFSKYDPNKTKKGGNTNNNDNVGSANAGDGTTGGDASGDAKAKQDFKLSVSLSQPDDVALEAFSNEIPFHMIRNSALMDSMFEVQATLDPRKRQTINSLMQNFGELRKPGGPKIDPITKKPTGENYNASVWLTTEDFGGLPCCEIWKDNGVDAEGNPFQPTLLYGHYNNPAMNERYEIDMRASIEAHIRETKGENAPIPQITKPDPFTIMAGMNGKGVSCSVIAQYKGLYKMGKTNYGMSWKVHQIILSQPKIKKSEAPIGRCMLLR